MRLIRSCKKIIINLISGCLLGMRNASIQQKMAFGLVSAGIDLKSNKMYSKSALCIGIKGYYKLSSLIGR